MNEVLFLCFGEFFQEGGWVKFIWVVTSYRKAKIMKEQEIYNHQLAIRYFEGRITPSEEEILFRFVNDAPSNERMFRQWEEEWMLSYKLIPEVSNEWKQLQRRMQVRQSLNSVFSTKHMQLQRFIAVAAIACVLLLSGTYSFYLYRNTETADNRFALETAYGEKSKLILADGTVVWLNAGSSLQYAGNFNSKNREVFLTGEAYFEVTKQSDGTPFVVKTDQYSVLVKGTKFNVSSYPEDISAKTTLLEGSIDILYKGRHIPVAPGELLSLDKQNGSFSRQKVQASQYKSWTEGRVEYDKITLNELAVRLSRKYDVQIHLGDDLEKDIAFRVSLRNEETVGDVFHALSEIIPIRYERRDRDIYIRKHSAIVNILLNLIL